jgi:ATP-binding cassette subfamily F protein 3
VREEGEAPVLTVHHISKSYGIQTLLDDVSFVINPGERTALIGVNGSGKSTLLQIIAGLDAPDSGSVALDHTARIGYLRQGLEPLPGRTIQQEIKAGLADWGAARAEVDTLADRMASATNGDLAPIMAAYDEALSRFEAAGGYAIEHRIEEIMAHLGLAHIDPQAQVARLSGGEQTRVGLAALLLSAPDILLLDEPTNHLDIEALEWLEGFISSYPGAALIVSHDRVFLDRTVNRVLELNEKTHQITAYPGSYTNYAEQKEAAQQRQWEAWKDQQAEIRRVRRDIQETMENARWVERTTTPREPGVRRYAKKVAKKAKSREKKLERYIESDERVEKPDHSWGLRLTFGEMPRSGQDVLIMGGIGHAFDGRGWLFRDLDATLRHGERVVLVGANGTGKSTLLRILAGDLAPQEGSVRIGSNVRIGYMPQKQETLPPDSTPLEVILGAAPVNQTEARNFLHFFLFAGDDVFTPVRSLSYGERSRLLLAKLVIGGANCLILDEPVNHLDITSRERFEEALEAFPGTIIAAAHDRAFIDRIATSTWSLTSAGIVVTHRTAVDKEVKNGSSSNALS